jgi:branched-subunit amino acid aminotransferase/4-amino-4-deoxychorismate lyase
MKTITCLLFVLLCSVGATFAQDSRGQIIGRVTDASGAAVPGAEIKVTNTATNVTLTSTSNEEGNYESLYLQPGMYVVRVTTTNGFPHQIHFALKLTF